MKIFFYLIAIWFIVHEVVWLISPKDKVEKSKLLSKLIKEFKNKEWNDYSREYKDLLKTKGVAGFTFLLWMVIGLFSFNWTLFLIFIVFQFIVIAPLSKLTKYSITYMVIHWINSLIGVGFGCFVIINSYHLKIDILELLLKLF